MGCGSSTPAQHAAKAGTVTKLETDTAKGAVRVTVFSGDSGAGTLQFPELAGGDHHVPAIDRKRSFGVCLSGGEVASTTHALLKRKLAALLREAFVRLGA